VSRQRITFPGGVGFSIARRSFVFDTADTRRTANKRSLRDFDPTDPSFDPETHDGPRVVLWRHRDPVYQAREGNVWHELVLDHPNADYFITAWRSPYAGDSPCSLVPDSSHYRR
jgi:hypothetical protein